MNFSWLCRCDRVVFVLANECVRSWPLTPRQGVIRGARRELRNGLPLSKVELRGASSGGRLDLPLSRVSQIPDGIRGSRLFAPVQRQSLLRQGVRGHGSEFEGWGTAVLAMRNQVDGGLKGRCLRTMQRVSCSKA